MKSLAYIVTSPSGKSYVGITKRTLKLRWRQHVCEAKSRRGYSLHAAIRRYGSENFSVRVLVQASWDYLVELEPKLISHLRTRSPLGYNLTSGGEQCDANAGRKLSPEWRRKLSEAHRRISPETRARMSISHKGRAFSLETRAKMSIAQRRYWSGLTSAERCAEGQKRATLRCTRVAKT